MSTETYLGHLASRAERTFCALPDARAFERFKAIVGASNLTAFGDLAEVARAKLRAKQLPSPKELAALEVAIRVMRPAPLVRSGAPAAIDAAAEAAFPAWGTFVLHAPRLCAAVCRIDQAASESQVGTGFLVAPSLIVTNRHVLDTLSFGTMALERGQASARFGMEVGGSYELVAILGVVAVHQTADLALLEIERGEARAPLAFEPGSCAVGDGVVTVGFPAEDTLRNPFFASIVFGGRYGVKRAAPGEVIEVSTDCLTHDCSTLGGNSGSPVISMSTGGVVAVHAEGAFMYRNGSVPAAVAAPFAAGIVR